MTLYDDLADEIETHLFDAADADTPTEAVTFRPDGGDPRTIRVFVDRQPAQPLGNAKAAVMHVTAINDATTGIATASLNLGRDQIDVSERAGVAAKTRQLYKIVSHDAAHVTLEVR